MNYLKEINAFYDQLELNPLSSSAIALWHTLMHINNKAGWKEQFTVAASVLCMKSGLKEGTFKKARNELKQKNYIDFMSRKGNQSAIYIIHSNLSSNNDRSISHNSIGSSDHSDSHNGSALVKQKRNETETKHNELASARVYQQAQKYFLNINAKDQDLLDSYIDDLGGELVLEAMDRAHQNGARLKYAAGIMNDWYRKGITDMDAVRRDDEKFESYKQQRQSQPKTANGMPDYDPQIDGF
ncbi:DnaD domain-containing protein [Alkalibacillus almallahensis]|uniref:DnaD domain-containing protein n=1 Tax=Alkalibacillus almallahensis TaxID=1379154 RepID=UPI001423A550|nr:DnaD domain protein [Alkalibacillus almallahensis]NIK12845.1 DnaD/phage-associated family protein [Alkalibacillus almallahensis]